MKNKNTEDIESTPFNMAMLFYMELHILRKEKSNAMLQDNLGLSYECLQEIYSKVHFKFNKVERKKLDDTFTKLKDFIEKNKLSEAKTLLRIIDKDISIIMHKYKMIFPKIELHSGIAGLYGKYGLTK